MNCLVSNAKAKRELDWNLKYPSYEEGLPATIREIEKQAENLTVGYEIVRGDGVN